MRGKYNGIASQYSLTSIARCPGPSTGDSGDSSEASSSVKSPTDVSGIASDASVEDDARNLAALFNWLTDNVSSSVRLTSLLC